MNAMQHELLLPSEPYSAEHAQAVARARVASVPQLVNEALVWALEMQRDGATDVRLAYIIKNLTEATGAPDSLRVEESLCQD